MSSIVIKGNTSGQVEIAAPDVAGSTTLTLPTGSGSIIKDDGSGNLSVSGAITGTGGIYLGGTASANLLDDYENGTWTPVLKAGATTLTASTGGAYVKTGNVVFASVTINNIVVSGSGTLTCTLPFTSNVLATGAVQLSRFTNPSNATYATVFLLNGQNYVTPHWVYNNNQNGSPIQVSHVTSSGSSDMYFSIVYRTA